MRGELDFEAALRERVALLKGLPEDIFARIAERIHFTPGAEDLVKELHKRGYKVGLVSGVFMRRWTDWLSSLELTTSRQIVWKSSSAF